MKTKEFPQLYKKNNEGKIQVWSIIVAEGYTALKSKHFAKITTTFGELKGKQQSKEVYVMVGKNKGKKNQTDKVEQAIKDAEGKFNKKLKSGYVKSLKAAKEGKTDKIIKGGIIPMLALKFQDYADKITFPRIAQPKLDGERCVAVLKKGKVTLWTRTRKPILSCPHIIQQLELVLKGTKDCKIDGELYKHGLSREDLEVLMGAVRKQKPTAMSSQVEFHIYDVVFDDEPSETFSDRLKFLTLLPDWFSHIKFVDSFTVYSMKFVDKYFKQCLKDGYEGIMIRDMNAPYQFKRSKALLKYKPRDDDEFKIVDVEQGKDGTVVFRCVTKDKKTFGATKAGKKSENQKYLKNKKKYIGKMLTVQYQGFTGEGKPMFASALRIRGEV